MVFVPKAGERGVRAQRFSDEHPLWVSSTQALAKAQFRNAFEFRISAIAEKLKSNIVVLYFASPEGIFRASAVGILFGSGGTTTSWDWQDGLLAHLWQACLV